MNLIQPVQIKAARAILGWSQEELANKAGLSITTIRNMELGFIPRRSTLDFVRKVVEKAGLEFTDGEGVRRRMDEVKILRGMDSTDAFFDDMMETLGKSKGDVCTVMASFDLLLAALGAKERSGSARLQKLHDRAALKGLIAERKMPTVDFPRFTFRSLSPYAVGPVSYFIYGGKQATVLLEGSSFKYVLFQSTMITDHYLGHFEALWDRAAASEKEDTLPRYKVR